jgi:FkbM family methyltransferase
MATHGSGEREADLAGAYLQALQRVGTGLADLLGRDSRVIRSVRPLYEGVLRALSFNQGIPWEINGEIFRIDPRFRHMLGHNYDADVAKFLCARLREGATCFDVGANVGVYVLQMARWVGARGSVVAFEPNPAALAVLRRHVAMNALEGSVTVVPKGIGSRKDVLSFFSFGADGMSRLAAPNPLIEDRAVESSVEVTTLDDYVEETGVAPDWVVMDIEGFEIHALRGFERTLAKLSDRVGVVVEFHPQAWASSGSSEVEARELLRELRRSPVPLTGQKDPWRDHGLVHLARERSGGR